MSNPMIFLNLAVNEHEEFFDSKLPMIGSMNLHPQQFHEYFCLSLNMGRQYGHTTFIMECLKYKDDCMLVYKGNDTNIKYEINKHPNLIHARRNHRILNVSSNNLMGIRLEGIKTIFVDRGTFWKSNKNIIAEVLDFFHKSGLMYNNKEQYRFVILG